MLCVILDNHPLSLAEMMVADAYPFSVALTPPAVMIPPNVSPCPAWASTIHAPPESPLRKVASGAALSARADGIPSVSHTTSSTRYVLDRTGGLGRACCFPY